MYVPAVVPNDAVDASAASSCVDEQKSTSQKLTALHPLDRFGCRRPAYDRGSVAVRGARDKGRLLQHLRRFPTHDNEDND